MATASVGVMIIIIAASTGYAVMEGVVYTSLVKRICNGRTYPFWSNHFNSPGVITGIIANETPDDPNFNVYDDVVNDQYTLYGHGFCSGSLSRDDCATCMNRARDQLFGDCSWHGVGAQIELQGCQLRYEEYYFGPPK